VVESVLPPTAGDVIVIDNAGFHHSRALKSLEAGYQIWYCAYSPRFEQRLSIGGFVLQNWMQQRWDRWQLSVIV